MNNISNELSGLRSCFLALDFVLWRPSGWVIGQLSPPPPCPLSLACNHPFLSPSPVPLCRNLNVESLG